MPLAFVVEDLIQRLLLGPPLRTYQADAILLEGAADNRDTFIEVLLTFGTTRVGGEGRSPRGRGGGGRKGGGGGRGGGCSQYQA